MSEAITQTEIVRQPLSVRLAGFALPTIFLLFIVFFSIVVPDTFPTWSTAITLLRGQSVLAILAIALIFPLIVGEVDLSVGANLGLGAILATGLPSQEGLPLWISLLLAVIACGLVGLINGLLVARIGINSMVATLGTSVIVTGSVLWYTMGNVFYTDIPVELPMLAQMNFLGIPLPAYFLAAVSFVAWFILENTPLGRYFYAIGGSKDAARLSGISIEKYSILAFVIAGALAGFAGILQSAQLGSGNPNVGPPFLLPAFASAFLGATAIKIGAFNVLGTIIAVFTVSVGITGLQLLGMDFFVAPIFQGVALIIAVTAARYLRNETL